VAKKHHKTAKTDLYTYPFDELPVVGTTAAGQEIRLGGFSGLVFAGADAARGVLRFITNTDRGPNPDAVDLDKDGKQERPFALPDFQPRLVYFEVEPATKRVTITRQLLLKRPDGTPLTGLPNISGVPAFAYGDEIPIDLYGKPLPADPYGADLESIVLANDGTFWLGDEYRPALYHFQADGTMIERYIPKVTDPKISMVGVQALPAIYAQRRINRGFEAIAYHKGILYAFTQSPLDNPDRVHDESSKASRWSRILAFDTQTKKPVGEYLYRLDNTDVNKLSDAIALGNSEFLVIESDEETGPHAHKVIYRVSLENATNLLERSDLPSPLEAQKSRDLEKAGIIPVEKELYIDLVAAGYHQSAKVEGLACIDESTFAVINDNDFAIGNDFDPISGLLTDNKPEKVILGIIRLDSRVE